MKYLKPYKLFEELELLDRGYSDNLKDAFKSDITEICLELDDMYPISISFDDSKYRSDNLHRSNDVIVSDERDRPLPFTTPSKRYPNEKPDSGSSIWKSNYPSITISRQGEYRGQMSEMPFKSGRGSGHFNVKLIENWNKECISIANRIKRYLGDNFLLFSIIDKGDEKSFELNDLTTPSSLGPFPRYNIETLRQGDIKMFRIIYNPDSYKI